VRSLAVVAFVLAAAACSDGDDDVDLVDPHAMFDLDVVVQNNGVGVWVRAMSGPVCHPPLRFPRPGECVAHSDAINCQGDFGTCITRVAVERNGSEIAAAGDVTMWWNALWVGDPALFAGGDAELVIEACGSVERIPISAPTNTAPTLTDLTSDGIYVRGTTTPTGATGTWASTSIGFISDECHEAGDDAWRVGPGQATPFAADLYLASIVGSTGMATPWGDAHVWQRQLMSTSIPILMPVRWNDMWHLDVGQRFTVAATTVDGGPSFSPGGVSGWGFRESAGGPRIYAWFNDVQYTAGESTDTLTVVRADGRFTGTFPHVAPTNDLDLALAGDNRIAISLPPVTLTDESNPALTHQVSLDLAWEHPLIPRPVP
jgi:hypothetical protein